MPRVTYCTRAFPGVVLQQFHNVRFLRGRTSAAHYSRTLTSQLYKFMLIILQTNLREKKALGLIYN